ncbi:MAG TPA: histidine phosphatase family protein [Candidatus Olsenella excrementavium]|uniref:Histidine phosphatase family protein n=1 Tax=Candidatus Olsenella excrementavium TaxID=2838709 RepID=A0A9D1ZAC8_9ACTN|nr:histidine phosphatase family protein [Candidatus Olsenella excrementavium]
MPMLYVLRHGQTEFNLQHRVQGRCDSPLTPLGVEQARAAGRWLAGQGVHFDRMCTSPLGRAAATLEVVREEYRAAGEKDLPSAELMDGLMERSYGSFESGPTADVPAELWDPGEKLVPYGGEGSIELRERVVATMTDIMEAPGVECALAVCHGSATLQFKLAWERLARCPQDVHLGNCCVLVFDYDPAARTFACEKIVNQGI